MSEREVPALVTVTAPRRGWPFAGEQFGETVTETFPATVRTRLVYEGRPAFLAADPVLRAVRCWLCEEVLARGVTDEVATSTFDLHLRVIHGVPA